MILWWSDCKHFSFSNCTFKMFIGNLTDKWAQSEMLRRTLKMKFHCYTRLSSFIVFVMEWYFFVYRQFFLGLYFFPKTISGFSQMVAKKMPKTLSLATVQILLRAFEKCVAPYVIQRCLSTKCGPIYKQDVMHWQWSLRNMVICSLPVNCFESRPFECTPFEKLYLYSTMITTSVGAHSIDASTCLTT